MPIDTKKLEKFDPLGVPTVTELLGEIDEFDGGVMKGVEGEGEGAKKIQDYEKTSLKPHVDYFRTYVAALLKSEKGVKREREEDEGMDF